MGVAMQAAAQEENVPARPTYWGFLALGLGAAHDSAFYAAGLGAALQRSRLVLMGRIAAVGPEGENRLQDVGLLAGIGTSPGALHALVSAGVGVARNSGDSTAIALPVEAQVTWRFARFAGVGVRGFLSLNRLSTFGGLTLVAQVGRLR